MASKSSSKKWLPLESNPDVIAHFAHTLGLPTTIGFHDIFGFDDDLLAMIPTPCCSRSRRVPSRRVRNKL